MSIGLIDPRPPPTGRGPPRTLPLAACPKCGKTFVAKRNVVSGRRYTKRFCGYVCAGTGLPHDRAFVAQVRERWQVGYTAGEIARWATQLTGRQMTRNAVIGLAHRNDFPQRRDGVR